MPLFPRSSVFLAILFLLGFAAAYPANHAAAQAPATAPSHTQPRPTSTPYTGDLSIFEYGDRDQKLQVQRVMDLLHLAPGKSVADIGAGSGWFSVRAAARITPTGTVYAEDINPEAIRYIDHRAKEAKLANIRTVLGTADDPKLPRDSVDAVLMLKSYHEIARPVELLERLKPSLRPGALLGIIDRNGTGADHSVMRDVVVREAGEAGFKLAATYDFTKADGQDYFLIFEERGRERGE